MTDKYDEQVRAIITVLYGGTDKNKILDYMDPEECAQAFAAALREIGQERDDACKAIDRWKKKFNQFDGAQESFDEACRLERDSLKAKLDEAASILFSYESAIGLLKEGIKNIIMHQEAVCGNGAMLSTTANIARMLLVRIKDKPFPQIDNDAYATLFRERDNIKQKLYIAEKALEFYADKDTWKATPRDGEYLVDAFEDDGELARQVLAKMAEGK